MKMIAFEMKKYVLKPSVLAFVLLFVFINLVKFFEIYYYFGGGRSMVAGYNSMSVGYNKVYSIYGGEITQEKIDGINAEYTEAQRKLSERGVSDTVYDDCYTGYPYGDVELFKNNLIPGYEYAIFYSDNAEKISAAEENVKFYSGVNAYEARKNSLISDVFKGRYIGHYVSSDGWTTLFDYKFSTILVMLLIILTFSPVFSGERAESFDKLIISSGKRKTAVRAKLAASGIFTFSSTLLFFLCDIFYVSAFHGLSCFGAPIYALGDYMNCPFTITLFDMVTVWSDGKKDDATVKNFFVSGGKLVMSMQSNSVYSLDISTRKMTYLFEDVEVNDLCTSGGKIYYTNLTGELICFDIDEKPPYPTAFSTRSAPTKTTYTASVQAAFSVMTASLTKSNTAPRAEDTE